MISVLSLFLKKLVIINIFQLAAEAAELAARQRVDSATRFLLGEQMLTLLLPFFPINRGLRRKWGSGGNGLAHAMSNMFIYNRKVYY